MVVLCLCSAMLYVTPESGLTHLWIEHYASCYGQVSCRQSTELFGYQWLMIRINGLYFCLMTLCSTLMTTCLSYIGYYEVTTLVGRPIVLAGRCDAQLVVDSLAGFQMHWLNSDRDRRGHWTLDSHVTGRGID